MCLRTSCGHPHRLTTCNILTLARSWCSNRAPVRPLKTRRRWTGVNAHMDFDQATCRITTHSLTTGNKATLRRLSRPVTLLMRCRCRHHTCSHLLVSPTCRDRDQSTINMISGLDGLNSSISPSKSVATTPTTTASLVPDRAQPQSGLYPPMSVQRPINNLSPVPMDAQNPAPRRSYPYPENPSAVQMDHPRPSQPSPNHFKYDDRCESGQQQPQLYRSPRPPYYPEGPGQPLYQSPYSQEPRISQWVGQNHSQQ